MRSKFDMNSLADIVNLQHIYYDIYKKKKKHIANNIITTNEEQQQ